MKKLILVLLVLFLGAGGLYVHFSGPETAELAIVGPNSREISSATREHLEAFASNIGATITTLIIGEQSQTDENAWNFRGALRVGSSTRTVFGSIQSICSSFQTSDCWQLSTLAIDGEFLALETTSVTETRDEANELSSLTDIETSSGVVSSDAEEFVIDKTIETGLENSNANSSEIVTKEIWFSKTDNVNGRTGPGTNFSVAFKIPADVPLTFLKTENKWGLFSYSAQGGGEGQIWVSLSLVERR